MSFTNTVQTTLDWLAAFVMQRPTSGVNAVANEPALTSANKIIASVLAAPFRWNWNRFEFPMAFTTVPGSTDYTVNIPSFGYLEKATISIAANNYIKELEVYNVLAVDPMQNEPAKIAAQLDDGAGNITFRLLPAPDNVYAGNLTIQKAPPVLTTLTQSWAPIPDKYAFLYETALVAHMQAMYNTQAFFAGMEMFLRQLVGAAEGLTEMEKAIFLEDSLRDLRAKQSANLETQYGKQARY